MFGRDEGVEGEDVHAEAASAAGDDAAYATEPDDAQGFAAKLNTDETFALPATALQAGVGLRHASRQRDQHGDGVLGGRDRIAVGRVHHDDAARRRRHNIYVIDADARAPDNPQSPGRLHQLGSHLCLAAHDQPLAIAYGLAQLSAFKPRSLLHRKARRDERLKTALAHIISDKYFHLSHNSNQPSVLNQK